MTHEEESLLELAELVFRRPYMMCPSARCVREVGIFLQGIARGLHGASASYTGEDLLLWALDGSTATREATGLPEALERDLGHVPYLDACTRLAELVAISRRRARGGQQPNAKRVGPTDLHLSTTREILMADAPDPVLAERVNAAIERLLVSDASLFDHNVNERSISHRLAVYLEREFGGEQWDVDCEYNRDGHEPKRLHLRSDSVGTDDVNGNTVYPDIIVHCRGTSKNHLAIEMKKDNGGPSSRDLEKLTAFRRQLGYAFALFLRFGVGQVHPTLVEAQWVA